MNRAIIEFLSDLDYYKITMQQLQFLKHRDAIVRLAFKCRTKGVNLPAVIPIEALREQLNHLCELRFTPEELAFLRESQYVSRGMFQNSFLDFLTGLQLPEISVEVDDDQFVIEAEGPWPVVTLVETLVLSVVNELYNHYQLKNRGHQASDVWGVGLERFERKLKLLGESDLHNSLVPQSIVEFGTRRRFSRPWQREITLGLSNWVPELFAGTSNVNLARQHDLRPIGTFAHEMDMAYSRLFGETDDDIRRSHGRMMEDWWELYGEPLSIALTDTYGTEFFFRDMTPVQARNWRGLRHDSGPWRQFGDKVLNFYLRHGVNPMNKTIVWSDGLSPEVVFAINAAYGPLIRCVYGWGTNLTNDFGAEAKAKFGIQPLSIVMKAVAANVAGSEILLPTVKLSDNPAKAVGPRDVVERFQRIFGYNSEDYTYEECVY